MSVYCPTNFLNNPGKSKHVVHIIRKSVNNFNLFTANEFLKMTHCYEIFLNEAKIVFLYNTVLNKMLLKRTVSKRKTAQNK